MGPDCTSLCTSRKYCSAVAAHRKLLKVQKCLTKHLQCFLNFLFMMKTDSHFCCWNKKKYQVKKHLSTSCTCSCERMNPTVDFFFFQSHYHHLSLACSPLDSSYWQTTPPQSKLSIISEPRFSSFMLNWCWNDTQLPNKHLVTKCPITFEALSTMF